MFPIGNFRFLNIVQSNKYINNNIKQFFARYIINNKYRGDGSYILYIIL